MGEAPELIQNREIYTIVATVTAPVALIVAVQVAREPVFPAAPLIDMILALAV